MDPEREHQQEGSEKGDEQVGRRPLSEHQEIIDFLGPVPLGKRRKGRRRHPAEHRIRPEGGVVRMGLVPQFHLAGHPQKAGNIALVHDFSLKDLRDEPVGKHQEKQNDAAGDGYFLPKLHLYSINWSESQKYRKISN